MFLKKAHHRLASYHYRGLRKNKHTRLIAILFCLTITIGLLAFQSSKLHESSLVSSSVRSWQRLHLYAPLDTLTNKAPSVPSPEQMSGSQSITTSTANDGSLIFSHTNIRTTVFWVGESADAENDYIANNASAWDNNWQVHFGGYDSPVSRKGYAPLAFTPKENPFYFALPYNDIDEHGKRKNNANNCPNAAKMANQPYSWCKNAWIAIRNGNSIAYAQWEDVGPNEEDDAQYVFGTAKSKNTFGEKAGLDVSPAVRDYLKLGDTSKNDWTFVSFSQVPEGPWRSTITLSVGDNL